jgi:pyridoxine 4-dehydrogenase
MTTAADAGTITLGGDLTVNRMGFGAMRITGEGIWGEPQDRDECKRVLRRAIELGVNFIDTADSYGPDVSEQLIAEELHPHPDDLVIATKGGLMRPGPGSWHADCHPERLKQCCEGSLRRLKLDRIDVYQLHTVDRNVPYADSVGALKELQDEGKIRHVGISNVSAENLAEARQIVDVVSVQNRYSADDRGSEEVLEACEREGIAFIPWFPLGAGKATQPGGSLDQAAQEKGVSLAQAALAWLLGRSEVMLPIPGTSKVEHLEENVAAAGLRL